MATFTGRTIANTYKGLLNIDNNNSGIDGTVRTVQDGEGTNSPLQLSNSILNVNGAFQIGGVQLTANVSSLNALADITGATGMIAVDGGTAYGRTLTGGSGVSITNANGTSGNPTIALNTTGVSAATYGPVSFITVNSVGQVTSATIPTSISVAEIKGSTFTTEYLNASANVSITGDTFVGGSLTVSGTTSVSNIVVTSIDAGQINSAIVSCSIMTANVLNVIGFGTSVTNFTANNLVVVSSTQITGIVSADNAVFSGNVSAANLYADTNIYIAGVAIPNATQITSVNDSITALSATMATSIGTANTRITSVSDYAVALSATMATSIGNSNTVIAAVSALTSVNLAAITSINGVIGDGTGFVTDAELAAVSATLATSIGNSNSAITALSATMATSIGTANTRITSVSDFAVALSSTLATSIGTANTRITSVSDYAVALSSTLATSIGNSNTAITALSATMATSIGTANTRITSVSDYAVALSATLATSVASRLPLAGGTITGTVSAQEVDVSSLGIGTVAGAKRLTMNGAAVAQYASLTDGATIAVNFNTAQNFIIQLAGNRTLENPTNCVAGQTGSIVIVQDGTGGRTLSYGTSWNFIGGTAPTLSTGVSAVDRIDYIVYTSTAVQAIASLDIK
jgi:trimeric autotransporter adhesin